ncbi:MAG: phosphoenolpyruvate--protein phosphotransferase [Bacteriovoracaceae bacterium]
MLVGKSASSGIAIGKALVILHNDIKIEEGLTTVPENEMKRLMDAIQTAKGELTSLHDRVLQEMGADKAAIFEAHLMILEDPEMIEATTDLIKNQKFKATYALDQVAKQFISIFHSMDNEYMKERAVDVKDVTDRILRIMLGIKVYDLSALKEDVILVAKDITPSEMATLKREHVLGLITEIGGKTSHTAIMARTLEIPAIVGLKDATKLILNNEMIAFSGDAGEVFQTPDEKTLTHFKKQKTDDELLKKELKNYIGQKSSTLDNHTVKLEANIASVIDTEVAMKNDAEGVGLFRTEFIYMDRNTAPTEDEQYEIYKAVLEKMQNRPTVIRTLDVGGDKEISYLKIAKEDNPFLGHRAIRYCLDNKGIFKDQLRALLRASVYGHLQIMFPMISGLEEVLLAKNILEEAKQELQLRDISYSKTVKIGIMIEIPSAAIMSDLLAQHVDFFSIGTNDLIQYTCAVDRMNEKVHHLYDPFHPAVLRLISQVISAGNKAGIEVAMCGEMASNQKLTEVLLGMGLTHFSMTPSAILKTRKTIRNLDYKKAQSKAAKVLALSSGKEIVDFLDSTNS